MALNTDQLKRPQHPNQSNSAAETDQSPVQQRHGIRGEVTAGLASVLTHQARQTADHIQVAEQFSSKAAKALAHKAHSLTSGEHFTQEFVAELNRLSSEQPFDGFAAYDWAEAETLLRDLGKPSLPPVKPNFLPPGK